MLRVCKCGYPVWVEARWNGLTYIPVYRDDYENSPTVGQEITNCPQCGEHLDRFHKWWIAEADTTDGYLELWETTIRIRGVTDKEPCPQCQADAEQFGILPSICLSCGADRTEEEPDKYLDLACEISLTGGNEFFPCD